MDPIQEQAWNQQAKGTTLFDVITHNWFKKKHVSNNKILKANDKLDRVLHEWLSNNFEENIGQIILYHGNIKPDGFLMIEKQKP